MHTPENEDKPSGPEPVTGIKIIGWTNLVFFGGLSLLANIYAFILSFNPETLSKLMSQISQYHPASLSSQAFLRAVFFWQSFIAVGFIISGWGIIKRRRWARKFSLYFAGLLLFLVAVGVVVQAAAHHPLAWFNIIISVFWPAVMIIFLTSAAANSYFERFSAAAR